VKTPPKGAIRFQIKDGVLTRVGEPIYKEVPDEPKIYHVRNRPGHVSPLHKRKK
jgi:hypothetical protein